MKLRKTASILSFLIGTMAIFAGGQVVLLHKVMDYYVIDWLPVYNLILGLLTVFVTTILIWKGSRFSRLATTATFLSHLAVMLTLQTLYKDVVAPDSIKAMIVRISVWVIILILIAVQGKKDKESRS